MADDTRFLEKSTSAGQTIVEYLLLVVLISLVLVRAVWFVKDAFDQGIPVLRHKTEQRLETGTGWSH